MNNEQQAETTEFVGVDSVLTKWNGTWTGDTAMSDAVGDFRAKKLINSDLALLAGADNSGFSENKVTAKKAAAEFAILLTGIAWVRFKKQGRMDLANQLDLSITDFTSASDGNCETMLNANKKVMEDNIGLLSPDYVEEEDITALTTLIKKYVDEQGTSEAVHSASPEITQKFADSFAPVKEEIDNMVRVAKKKFGTTVPKFVDALVGAAQKPTVNVHHTIISITATKKSDGKAAEGVVFSETKSGKMAVTNYLGEAEISKVKSGEDVLTGSFNGAQVYSAHIKNKRGTNNHYNIVIESL